MGKDHSEIQKPSSYLKVISANFNKKSDDSIGMSVDLVEVGGKELECNLAIEFDVLGEVDLTHPAGADLLDDPVVVDDCTFSEHGHCVGLVVVRFHTSPEASDSAAACVMGHIADQGEDRGLRNHRESKVSTLFDPKQHHIRPP